PFGIHTILIQPGYIMTSIQSTAMDLAQPYEEKFKTGPYAGIYASYLGNATSTRAQSKTTPEDCARVMLKAIEATRPKALYGVIRGGFCAREFNRVDAAEVLDLVARSFQPHVLDARDFSSHVLDAANRLFPVVIRYIVFKFVHHHVQHRFRLPEPVLYRLAACMQRPRRDSCGGYYHAKDNL